MSIRVYNRSRSRVEYELPELHVRREFEIDESKNIEEEELNMLCQQTGGKSILLNYLVVDDKIWADEHLSPEIEYWWKPEDIKNCLLNDSLDLFSETLDYAPTGVLEYIEYFSYTLPLTDLNKISIIKEKLGFDVLKVTENLSNNNQSVIEQEKPTRRRRQEA